MRACYVFTVHTYIAAAILGYFTGIGYHIIAVIKNKK